MLPVLASPSPQAIGYNAVSYLQVDTTFHEGKHMTEEIENKEQELPIEEILEEGENSPPALTINIQSWWTPVVGIIMLVVGLLGGYYGREWIPALGGNGSSAPEPVAEEQGPPPTPNATQIAQQQALMEFVTSQTRHFLGDENAPITLLEFSDFL